MPQATRPVPRLVNDTVRTLVVLGVQFTVTIALSGAFQLVARRYGFRTDPLTYLACALLVAFGLYFVLYQLVTWRVLRRAPAAQLTSWAQQTTPHSRRARRLEFWTGSGVRAWAVTAALLALATVLAVLLVPQLRSNLLVLALSLVVVASSWTMVAYAYAVSYLRLNADRGGLEFPGGPAVVWSDYVYLAVQVNVTFSSSDVGVSSRQMRRLVTSHTLLAFLFNTVILALLVSALVTLAG